MPGLFDVGAVLQQEGVNLATTPYTNAQQSDKLM
jgi:hypothetical protein